MKPNEFNNSDLWFPLFGGDLGAGSLIIKSIKKTNNNNNNNSRGYHDHLWFFFYRILPVFLSDTLLCTLHMRASIVKIIAAKMPTMVTPTMVAPGDVGKKKGNY